MPSAEQLPDPPRAEAPPRRAPKLNLLQRAWLDLAITFSNLGAVPVILGLLGAVGFLLLGTKQGADLAHSVVEGDKASVTLKMAMLVVSSLVLGGGAWFWSRRMVVDACGPARETWRPRWLLELFPRVLGALPFAFAGFGFMRSGEPGGLRAVLLLVLAVAFGLLLAARKKIEAYVAQRTRPLTDERRERLAQRLIQASLWLALAMMVWFSLAPVWPAQRLGAIGVVYLGVGLIIPVIAWLIHKGRRWRLPITGGLICLSLLFSWAGGLVGDNHAVGRRAFGGGWDRGPQAAAPRPNFPAAFDAWWDAAPGVPGQPKPMIVVAAAGGASRAGYWTANVLGDLQDQSGGRFANNLFAISSVSGGSVGAAAFVSQLYDNPQADRRFGEAVREAAGGDFLSPAIAGLLFPDLAQRFLPTIPLGHGMVLALPDRAEALEKAFEQSWTDHCRHVECRNRRLWREPLQTLWSDPSRPMPLLFLNGAREEDGRRVITSRVIIDSAEFPDAVDFYAAVQERDLAISSAIHNSARFPIVSPGGALLDQDGRPNGHILDGGYFENSGLTTAADIVHSALSRSAATNRPVRPIVIELNNDSDEDPASPVFDRGWAARRSSTLVTSRTDYFLSDLLGPLAGLSSARDGRATPVAIRLSRELGPDYVLVRLANTCDGEPPSPRKAPMDWVLSRDAKAIIRNASACERSNREAIGKILAAVPPAGS